MISSLTIQKFNLNLFMLHKSCQKDRSFLNSFLLYQSPLSTLGLGTLYYSPLSTFRHCLKRF